MDDLGKNITFEIWDKVKEGDIETWMYGRKRVGFIAGIGSENSRDRHAACGTTWQLRRPSQPFLSIPKHQNSRFRPSFLTGSHCGRVEWSLVSALQRCRGDRKHAKIVRDAKSNATKLSHATTVPRGTCRFIFKTPFHSSLILTS